MAKYNRNDMALVNVGNNIRKYRKLNRLTIVELEYKTNIHQKSLWAYETAKTSVSITNLYIIAEALNVQAYELLMPYEENVTQ
ncbi:helix-turn-helix domain-containing protein [Pedobacter sp. L105]|uniref:helix-turn-helix domain-containing protein n=1 Tax=Pedobacter sp. L105 TaxID=1641871 RepID=UPI00352B3F35